MDPFYEICAEFYDDDYDALGRAEDVPFYVELAREAGGTVLEMGCGSGRVTLPVARAGIEVVAVDASSAMLGRLRAHLAAESSAVARRVEVVAGDIRSLDLGRRFPLVIAPFRVVQHLVSRSDQRAWLRAVARHLEPGGELVFDVFQPDYDYLVQPAAGSLDVERSDSDTGCTIRRFSSAHHTPAEQTFTVRVEWHVEEPGGASYQEHAAETTVRWFTRYELENLLELEGYEILDLWGDFDRTPFGPEASEQIVRARRAQ
ncbi:MAG TPA: class I SAM-dependent methyltransferase [Thermoanaerobaculia bacterium]|nr:class I SAM-dependent methyltransferase [Thermoanaerobaculia bacterium]